MAVLLAALRLARGGLTVALVARRADRLTKVAAKIAGNAGTAVAYPVDLTDAAGGDSTPICAPN